MSARPAWLPSHENWVPVSEAARIWGRSIRTIQLWCQDGTFATASIRTHFDSTTARTGQWWICVPSSLSSASPCESHQTQVVA